MGRGVLDNRRMTTGEGLIADLALQRSSAGTTELSGA
jgi:hypothetical protein